MKNRSFQTVALAAFTALVSLSAVAQTRYCIGGDLEHLSAAERASCSAAKEQVKAAATHLHAPEEWHFVVVCGEQGWKDYTAVADRGEVALENSFADTDFAQRVTYIRESKLHSPEHHELDRVVAHEVASIQLLSHDEPAIEARLAGWGSAPYTVAESAQAGASVQNGKPMQHGAGL